jgi:AGZA family xanthine/uracil permease-like MFS transporter
MLIVIDGALSAAGTSARAVGMEKNSARSVCFIEGAKFYGGGAILIGLVFSAIAAFIINKDFLAAAAFRRSWGTLDLLRFHA